MATQSDPELHEQHSVIKSLPQAQECVTALNNWARERWGVKMEKVWRCPLCDYELEYENDGYCPDHGRKLKEITKESERQDWKYNLDDFMSLPDYPAPPKEEE